MGRTRWTRKKTKEIGNTTANHHPARLIDPRCLPKKNRQTENILFAGDIKPQRLHCLRSYMV